MTTSSTQIGYLDLEAFYQHAKNVREFTCCSTHVNSKSVVEICDKLICVIDAIRADGLDPRWNPERDALDGLIATGSQHGIMEKAGMFAITQTGAEMLIDGLHKRGYKIVKDETR